MKYAEFRKKLEDIHQKDFLNWEEDRKADQFGRALWAATEEYIQIEHEFLSRDELADKVFDALKGVGFLTHFLTDNLRKIVIKYHVRNQSTTDAVLAILCDERYKDITPFYLFKFSNVCGFENIKKFLVARLSYLKPGNVHFPQKKYGKLWDEARQEYLDNLKDIPLTSVEEQLQALSEHHQDLTKAFREADKPTDKERFHKCIMRTMAAIHLITQNTSINANRTPALKQENRPALQHADDTQIIEIPNKDVTLVSS